MPQPSRSLAAAALMYSPGSALAAYHSTAIIDLVRANQSQARAFYQAPAVTDGRGFIAGAAMSLSEMLLFALGAIIFTTALSLAIGIATRLITVG
jgi:hypothetical protein